MNLQPQGRVWLFRADVAMPYFNEKNKKAKVHKKNNSHRLLLPKRRSLGWRRRNVLIHCDLSPEASGLSQGGFWEAGSMSSWLGKVGPAWPFAPGDPAMVLGDWGGT